jgi:uncharacterized protein YegL
VKRSNIVIISIVISLAAHTALFAASPFIVLPGMKEARSETRRMFRLKEVEEEPVRVKPLSRAEVPVPSIKMTRRISEQEKKALRKMKLDKKLTEDLALKDKEAAMKKELQDKLLPEKPEKFDIQEMLKTEAEKAKKEAAPEKKSLAQRLLAEEPLGVPGKGPAGEEDLLYDAERESYARPAALRAGEPQAGYFQPGREDLAALEGEAQIFESEDIDRHIGVRLLTYIDPRTKEKYFKLMIYVMEGDGLEVIPKEITFLVDSSKSVTEEKLSNVKKAVERALKNLNPADRFNVVAFRGDVVRFRDAPVKVAPQDVHEAGLFLKKLVATGQTDVNAALLEIVSNHITMYPSYVMLVSDGRPTMGVMDSRRIIQQITRRNNMERPIFCFGAGARVNKYLLDFISYQNRAWSRFAPDTYSIGKDFAHLYRQIKDPLLIQVRYRFRDLDTEEIYPKYLSDFYRGRPFTLYGLYDDEDVFTMQLLGEIKGQTKEFIYKGSLAGAEKGGEEIAREWAFRKIYYLISQITMGMGDPRFLRREINKLSKKYNIITPYDLEETD